MISAATAPLLALGAALLMSSCGPADEGGRTGGQTGTERDADAPLRVEAAEGPRGTELIVYVQNEAANVPSTAAGKKEVTLRCVDKAHRLVVSKPHPWPFTDTDKGLVEAHVHQRVPRTEARQVSRCELEGTRGPLGGEVASSGFR